MEEPPRLPFFWFQKCPNFRKAKPATDATTSPWLAKALVWMTTFGRYNMSRRPLVFRKMASYLQDSREKSSDSWMGVVGEDLVMLFFQNNLRCFCFFNFYIDLLSSDFVSFSYIRWWVKVWHPLQSNNGVMDYHGFITKKSYASAGKSLVDVWFIHHIQLGICFHQTRTDTPPKFNIAPEKLPPQ